MKVLVTSFSYPPNKDGVSQSAKSLAEGLAGRGHKVVVATGVSDRYGEATVQARLQIERFRIFGSPLSREGISGETEAYRNFVLRGGFDALICACLDTWPTYLLLPQLPSFPGRKILLSHGFSAHRWYPHHHFPWGLRAWLRGLLFTVRAPSMLSSFDKIVFLSRRRDFGRFFDHNLAVWSHHPSIHILANSVDDTVFGMPQDGRSFRNSNQLGDREIFLCIANYSARKNQQLALRAFAQAGITNAALVFIGDESNEYSRELERSASSLTLPKGALVKVLTDVSRADTISALHEATVFLLTAKEETQPIVLLESMAAGLPFISTPTGCVSEMPGGITAASASQLAAAMRLLISDNAMRRSLACKGLAYARNNCSREASIDAMEALIKRERVND